MRIEYDQKHDVLNVEFLEEVDIEESMEQDGIVFDFSKDKRLVSVEIMDARKRMGKNPLESIDFSIIKDKVVAI
jgi:uncharacterized protein YuzE